MRNHIDACACLSLPLSLCLSLCVPCVGSSLAHQAIFTGSAVVIPGAAPDGKSPGIVHIYPGLCNKQDWPACETGTLLAQAVPADYENDELLEKWAKPSYVTAAKIPVAKFLQKCKVLNFAHFSAAFTFCRYNPIIESTQRDPSTPWKTSYGEYRLRTFDQKVCVAKASRFLKLKFASLRSSSLLTHAVHCFLANNMQVWVCFGSGHAGGKMV